MFPRPIVNNRLAHACQSASHVMQLEFFAEDELITIVPNFSLPTHGRNTLRCIGVSVLHLCMCLDFAAVDLPLVDTSCMPAGRVWAPGAQHTCQSAVVACARPAQAQELSDFAAGLAHARPPAECAPCVLLCRENLGTSSWPSQEVWCDVCRCPGGGEEHSSGVSAAALPLLGDSKAAVHQRKGEHWHRVFEGDVRWFSA